MANELGELRAPAIEVIAVPNDGVMSDQPTNATIVGTDEVIIVDPGDQAGVAVIQEALARRGTARVLAIILTHGHHDHSLAAPALKQIFGCPIMLHPAERPILPHAIDWSAIDLPLEGGMTLSVDGGRLEAIDTPGHTPGHVALYEPVTRTLIAGDLISGHGSVGIFPPHGKMIDYFASLERAGGLGARTLIPGHGPTLTQPPDLFAQYIERRMNREREIFAAVAGEPVTIEAILPGLYPDVSRQFRGAAAATILAHLEKLRTEGRVVADADDPRVARWSASV